MAWVQETAKAITYSFVDLEGNPSTLTLYAPVSVIQEDIDIWAQGVGYTTVLALTNASIIGYTTSQSFRQDAPQAAVEASDVERKGKFPMRVSGGGVSTFSVPSIKNEKVVNGSNILNPADADVLAFQAMLVDTGIFDLVGLGNFRGDALVAPSRAPYKAHRSNPNG